MTSDGVLVAGLSERRAQVTVVQHAGMAQVVFWSLSLSLWHDFTHCVAYSVGVVSSSELEGWTQVAGFPCLVLIGDGVSVAIAIMWKL